MKKGRLYAVLSVLLIVLLCTSVAEFQTDNAYNNAEAGYQKMEATLRTMNIPL